MRDNYEKQLKMLNNEMIEMGKLIENAIDMAISALKGKDKELAKKVINLDTSIDKEYKDIENMCLNLLLRQQPVAADLRNISSALKMITDMERIGDHAADISEITLLIADSDYENNLCHIEKMAQETTWMLVNSIDAFINKDEKKARDVIEHDDIVDNLFDVSKNSLIGLINKNIARGEQAADLLMISKYFERIGDHATNIAEWVIYSITGIHNDMN